MAAQTVRDLKYRTPHEEQLRKVPLTAADLSPPNPTRQAYQILRFGFTVAPIVAGADKFLNLLVDWEQYLASVIPQLTGISGRTFMLGVGVIEMIAGIGVALKPRVFSYVVAAWLLGIVVNLLMTGQYFDIALRDFGLALGALALGRISKIF